MTVYAFEGNFPIIHESVFLAPDANIIGKISLNEKSSVWFCSTLRGDNELISVGLDPISRKIVYYILILGTR